MQTSLPKDHETELALIMAMHGPEAIAAALAALADQQTHRHACVYCDMPEAMRYARAASVFEQAAQTMGVR